MKLITEYIEDGIEYVSEASERGKNLYIEGIFAQAHKRNRNGRVYPRDIMEGAVTKYVNEQVSKGRAVGELNHPESPTINLDKVSHRIVKLQMEGDNVMGKALILDTPMGKIVKGLMEGGVKLGVSTRGMGSVEEKNGSGYVGKNFILSTVDIVQDPSAHEAFVNGIMEGVEWIYENGIVKPEKIKEYETEIRSAPKSVAKQVQESVFRDFLSKL